MSEERTPQQSTDDAELAPAVAGQGDDGQEPDVLLDVSELEVDRINLEEILERSERGAEGAAQRTLGVGPTSETEASP